MLFSASLGGMVQSGLEDRLSGMDSCRAAELYVAVVASTTSLARSMHWSFMKMGRRKMVAATSGACAAVCVQGWLNRFVFPIRYRAFWCGLRFSDDVRW